MLKRAVIVSALFVVLAGLIVAWRLPQYVVWQPKTYDHLVMADSYQHPHPYQVRWLAQHVSDYIYQNAVPPVTAAVTMSVALRSYADLYEKYGRFVAIFGAAQVTEILAPGAYEKFLQDQETAFRVIEDAGAGDDIQRLIEGAEAIRDAELQEPAKPDDGLVWYVVLGNADPDFKAGSLPLTRELDIALPPPPPEPDTIQDQLDIAATLLATRLSNDHQKDVSVYWQGAMAFEKTSETQGYTPTDVWQLVANVYAIEDLNEDQFVTLVADLADVVRDTAILIWQTKYKYWSQRPSMRRTDLWLHIDNPPFPGYVSGHAGMAAAAAEVLSKHDPRHADIYRKLAQDSAHSRYYGGVHIPSDNTFGAELGRKVAAAHMGQAYDNEYGHNPLALLDLVLVQAAHWAVDMVERVALIINPIDAEVPQFKMLDGDEHRLPTPRNKDGEPSGYEAFLGGIAVRDLDGDGDGDVLVSGYKQARLYENLGGFNFRLANSFDHPELVGAYFTHDGEGAVSGIMAFGYAEPVWFAHEGGFDFGAMTPVAGAETTDWYSFGIILDDHNGDGVEDAIFLNYSPTETRAGSVNFDPNGVDNRLALWDDGRFVMVDGDDGIIGRQAATFGGGYIDMTGDGLKELVLINDGQVTEILGGDQGHVEPLALDGNAAMPLAGMSYTPIRLGGAERVGIHVANVYQGVQDDEDEEGATASNPVADHAASEAEGLATWPLDDVDGEEAPADLMLVYDPQRGIVFDYAQGRLQELAPEWSWGSAAGDLNGDGLDDLVITSGLMPSLRYHCGARLLMQTRDGDFMPATKLAGLDDINLCLRSAVFDDFDGDGDYDIMVSNGFALRVFENLMDRPPGNKPPAWQGKIRGFLTQPRS